MTQSVIAPRRSPLWFIMTVLIIAGMVAGLYWYNADAQPGSTRISITPVFPLWIMIPGFAVVIGLSAYLYSEQPPYVVRRTVLLLTLVRAAILFSCWPFSSCNPCSNTARCATPPARCGW